MKKPRTKRLSPDISILPAGACPVCGTPMRERRARLSFPVNGEKVPDPGCSLAPPVALDVWNLRSRRCFRVIETSLAEAKDRFGLRIIEFSVLGNHLHLVVEADSSAALSRGMQGLNIRIAKALNRLIRRRGSVFADHYHPRVLRTPTELVNAIAYVLGNAQHHHGICGPDPYSSAVCNRTRLLSHPRTWLLRAGWRRARTRPQWLTCAGPRDDEDDHCWACCLRAGCVCGSRKARLSSAQMLRRRGARPAIPNRRRDGDDRCHVLPTRPSSDVGHLR
jgi:putative transposase